ncbi:hypothetical protein BKA65DRAFT_601487 [Rhexocercosporidium sp. MPI-PUGE-AT-0058]|nr:hypothetical protein BKA65DRAFT_601487 [Rhexocercosporidium sp. MPI-PUGE-AT-0058]
MKLSVILSLTLAAMAFGALNVQENVQGNALEARQRCANGGVPPACGCPNGGVPPGCESPPGNRRRGAANYYGY